MCPLLQCPTSAPSVTSLSIPLKHSVSSSPPPFLSPLLHPSTTNHSSILILFFFFFFYSFPSFLLLFQFLIIHLLLCSPLGEKLPLSQAKTINQSLVSFSLFALNLPSLLHFPALNFSFWFPYTFRFSFLMFLPIICVFYGLICARFSVSPSTALFDLFSRPLLLLNNAVVLFTPSSSNCDTPLVLLCKEQTSFLHSFSISDCATVDQ